MAARRISNWFIEECQTDIERHTLTRDYFLFHKSHHAAAVYERAIQRIQRVMEREKAGANQKYKPNRQKLPKQLTQNENSKKLTVLTWRSGSDSNSVLSGVIQHRI